MQLERIVEANENLEVFRLLEECVHADPVSLALPVGLVADHAMFTTYVQQLANECGYSSGRLVLILRPAALLKLVE